MAETILMGLPLAYFLTWTCYGQRLHGDARGSVDRSHNSPETPMLAENSKRSAWMASRMSSSAFAMAPSMTEPAAAAMRQLCRERGWFLLAVAVRTTHTHVVVNCSGNASPERAMSQFKARITRELRRAGLIGEHDRLWTRHGSTRWINHMPGLEGAIGYVNEWQSGPNREVLEARKREIRDRVESLRAWLRAEGLPETGLSVVAGESAEHRRLRVWEGDDARPGYRHMREE